MALVEIEAGPSPVIAAITRDAVEELAWAGRPATAAVKATSVMVERGREARRGAWPPCALAAGRARGCGGGDEGDSRALVVSAAASLKNALTACSATSPVRRCASRSPARTSWPRRSGGRRGRTCSPPRTPSCPTTLPRRAWSSSRCGSPPTSWSSPSRRRATSVASLGDLAAARARRWPSARRSVPVGDYTREVLARLPARSAARSWPTCAPASRTSRAWSASSPRARGRRLRLPLRRGGQRRAAARRSRCPTRCEPTVVYGAAVVTGGSNPAAARRFVDGHGLRRLRGRAAPRPASEPTPGP